MIPVVNVDYKVIYYSTCFDTCADGNACRAKVLMFREVERLEGLDIN